MQEEEEFEEINEKEEQGQDEVFQVENMPEIMQSENNLDQL